MKKLKKKNQRGNIQRIWALMMVTLFSMTSTLTAYAIEIDMSPVSSATTAIGTLVAVGGGAWGGWGLVSTGFALKDQDGSGIKTGLLQLLGGVCIVGAGAWIGSLG